MMEVKEEAVYVPHHLQKIILIFSSMRHFANELQQKNFKIDYMTLDTKHNKHSFTDNVKMYLDKHHAKKVIITEPGEYRVLEMIESWESLFKVPVEMRCDDRFFCSIEQFKSWAKDKKSLRMETFYRAIRKKTGVLMSNGEPVGDKWNFDKENRKPPKKGMAFPPRKIFKPDEITENVIKLVKKNFSDHFGEAEPFHFAVTRKQALSALNHFIKYHLAHFGDYQDAMIEDEYYLHHSILSPYLNLGLLSAHEVVAKAERAYHENNLPINAVEGFIRQIIGWREFIRGIYWLHMPRYVTLNALNAKAALPDFYWTGETNMSCLRHAIKQTRETATSHHIQRLMVTGNFAMLLGVKPVEICDWYLAVYADAFEWVELPNTLGMSQFADGGILASKPYAASGNYINKMSNFCKQCHYNVKERTGENACPFNALYWDFIIRNLNEFKNNPRMSFVTQQAAKMSKHDKDAVKKRATWLKKNI